MKNPAGEARCICEPFGMYTHNKCPVCHPTGGHEAQQQQGDKGADSNGGRPADGSAQNGQREFCDECGGSGENVGQVCCGKLDRAGECRITCSVQERTECHECGGTGFYATQPQPEESRGPSSGVATETSPRQASSVVGRFADGSWVDQSGVIRAPGTEPDAAVEKPDAAPAGRDAAPAEVGLRLVHELKDAEIAQAANEKCRWEDDDGYFFTAAGIIDLVRSLLKRPAPAAPSENPQGADAGGEWVMVPREATAQMRAAFLSNARKPASEALDDFYSDLLAAAPRPTQEKG
jgi:hypothetical protein